MHKRHELPYTIVRLATANDTAVVDASGRLLSDGCSSSLRYLVSDPVPVSISPETAAASRELLLGDAPRLVVAVVSMAIGPASILVQGLCWKSQHFTVYLSIYCRRQMMTLFSGPKQSGEISFFSIDRADAAGGLAASVEF